MAIVIFKEGSDGDGNIAIGLIFGAALVFSGAAVFFVLDTFNSAAASPPAAIHLAENGQ